MITVIYSKACAFFCILICFLLTDNLFAQGLPLPLSFSVIDDITFDQYSIKKIGAEKADIVSVEYDLNKVTADTTLNMTIIFDSFGRIKSQSLIGFDGSLIKEVRSYEDSVLKIKSIAVDSVLKTKYPLRPDWVETDILNINGRVVSKKVSGFFVHKGTSVLVQYDTLIYQNDVISKESHYYYKNDGDLLDTSIIDFKYDTLGRIISKIEKSKHSFEYITWSFYLNTNQVYQNTYSYEKNKTRVDRVGILLNNNIPIDTFGVSSYAINSIINSPDLQIHEIQDKNEVYTHMVLLSNSKSKTESLFDEVKKTEYLEGTNLPIKICLLTDNMVYVYYINYIMK